MSEDSLEAAREVAAQAREAVRRACAGGVVLALPALPGHPPRRNAPQQELHAFEDRVLQLTALAALTGAPQVCLNMSARCETLSSSVMAMQPGQAVCQIFDDLARALQQSLHFLAVLASTAHLEIYIIPAGL